LAPFFIVEADMITPETCPHPEDLCSECSSWANCQPVVPRKFDFVPRLKHPGDYRKKKRLPAWLADASASVRRDYGY
jgi:hypothetical protein